jgi:hypothetical protein
MNANQWFKENSLLVIFLAVVLIISFLFWQHERSTSMETSVNKAWVETPAPEMAPVTIASPAPVSAATGTIEWCAQINQLPGGHLPHLLNLGVNTPQGGQNWYSNLNSSGTENWGILNDGSYFIKKTIADQAAAQLGVGITIFQVKTSENNWSSPKTGTLGMVNGQEAWIFK